jgi:hypothetical protein
MARMFPADDERRKFFPESLRGPNVRPASAWTVPAALRHGPDNRDWRHRRQAFPG